MLDCNRWRDILKEKLPLLGHRNWIVVTDMAYPLQSNPGVQTFFAQDPFNSVVKEVAEMIEKASHVFAHIYLDEEQHSMSETLCHGWDAYTKEISSALDMSKVVFMPHEDIIRKLDEVSKLFNVVIIKTSLTIPYSSVFFELDCAYWDAEREAAIRKLK